MSNTKLSYIFSKLDEYGNYMSWNGGTYSKDSHGKMIINMDTVKKHILYDMVVTNKINPTLDTVVIEKFDVRYNKKGEEEIDLLNIVPDINSLYKMYDDISNVKLKNKLTKYRKIEVMKELIKHFIDGFDISYISIYEVENNGISSSFFNPSYKKIMDYLSKYDGGNHVKIPKYQTYGHNNNIVVLFDKNYDPIKERLITEIPFVLTYEK